MDLFSIYETQGTLDNLNVAFVGDLKYGRTVHSLTQALSKFNNVRFFFIAPEVLEMPDYICEELEEMGIQYSTHSSIEEVVPELDVLYMTRVPKERFDASEYAHIKSAYILTADTLKDARQTWRCFTHYHASTKSPPTSIKRHTLTTSNKLKTVYTLAKPY